ncbi:MAG: bifunctional oligoribonuclease/PAP phosphatase NrnA [Corynebacterium sp.]|uniref:DHH family phosphoesterase n=1 Tax=Corynebacterium sp. TaxID=1720 RepID=UPI0026DC7B2A|nr:bifunctional oligoribonuclease/PAP phosphatase NrnA [Corynebacterium sp.]MDO5029258.1 bifunctional oligoribonuclease/PAP phosphatase NrnA [Corynebacterium sp.]
MTTSPQAQEQAAHQLSQAIGRRMSKPIQQTQDMLADAKKVGVICHVHPDADAIGAASAMVMALRQRGIFAEASYGESDLPAKSLLTIPGWDRFVEYVDLEEDIDTWITVDCASPGRLGALEERVMASDRIINVDHHSTNTRFGTVNLVDELAESSTMVLLDFFGVWGIKLTREMAHALYAGLLTDTASFQFGRSRMHTAAARLLDKGLDPRTIGAQLLEEHPFEYLPFLGRVLSTATLVPEWGGGAGLIHVVVDYDQTEGVGHDEIESVVDIVRTTNAADVCAVLKEYEPGQWAVSLRSRERVDVSQVALAIGGGGHQRAAGLTRDCTRAELLQAILDTSDVAAKTLTDDSSSEA